MEARDDTDAWLATMEPTRRQTLSALTVAAIILLGFCVLAPLADTQLLRLDAFIPSFEATVFVTDLITSILLFSQFSIYYSRALLALACGYLFTALIIVPHLLTFPGVFAPGGLLGAGLQTTVWLYWVWHVCFPVALLIYASLKDDQHITRVHLSPRSAIGVSASLIFVLVCGLTWLTTTGDKFLPRLFLDRTHVAPLNHYVGAFASLACVSAFVVLWFRRRSVLDQWLMIVALAATAELALASLSSGRFTLGFYAGRMFSVITSTAVLGVLLAETTKLYGQLARSNMLLGRERKNKLVSMEAMAASISHELNQPLTAISMNGEAGLSYLEVMPPHLEEVRESLDLIVRDSHRASQILLSVRALLGKRDSKQEPVDLNEIVAESLRTLRRELTGGGITTRVQLAPDLLPIMGSRNQLNEVIINLVRNATEAMQQVEDDHRVLQVSTGHQDNAITLAVEDSGPGISPENLDRIFDAFVTTKPQGMGLGLAICQMIIERHAGQLSVSSADRHGAIFRIVLPRMELPH